MFKHVLLFLISFNAIAGDVISSAVCPSITSEAGSIISSIQNLKSQLKSSAECQPIQEKLSVVSSVINNGTWKTVKSALTSSGAMNLEGEDIKEIKDLSEKASYALTDVIHQISNNQKCLDDKNKASFMSNLSGVVKEVATIVGGVAGPYGVAVSLGGNIIASAITGIDKYYKAKHPYNFKKADEELLFMNQFCAFSEIQKDVNDYINLDGRPEELDALRFYMDIKKNDLLQNCPECNAYYLAFNANDQVTQIIKRIKEDAQIVDTDKEGSFTRCNEINRAIFSSNSDLNQLFHLLGKYKNPMMSDSDTSLIQDIVQASANLPLIYPKLTVCWNLPQKEKQQISSDFNNFLRDDILPLGTSIFSQQLNTFRTSANKKFKNPLGDYIERTLMRQKWVQAEYDKALINLNDPNYSSSVQTIITHQKKLKDRIFDQLAVDYFQFLKRRNLRQLKRFIRLYEDFSKESLKKYSKLLGKEFTSVLELLAALDAQNKVEKRIFLSALKDVRLELDLALTQTKTLDRYCHFMNYMLLITDKTNRICSEAKDDLTGRYSEASGLDSLTQNYIASHFKWMESDGNYQSSRVKDYSIHLEEWIERGNERWELKERK
ncbi:MAG: hypothetical protein ACOYL6_19300 [Bacteriovoracaceae bacterium]